MASPCKAAGGLGLAALSAPYNSKCIYNKPIMTGQ